MSTKKRIVEQNYENYWKLTLEYTDYKEYKFNFTLRTIVEFIDRHEGKIETRQYNELQKYLLDTTKKADSASIRKAINQFLKLGFINNEMKSYHQKTKMFLEEKDDSRKKRIYSEILYDNASFKRSYSHSADEKEINFLIKTLEHCGSISKENLIAIMFQDILDYPKGYINLDELEKITEEARRKKVFERKYNQVSYLYGICKNILTGIYTNKEGNLTLDRDEQIEEYISRKSRDSYKQRLYKYDLYNESKNLNNNKISCYYEDISYPVLIASHIKPYIKCNDDEKFDVDNGLLLSKNIDSLFDQGWISFENDGTVLLSKNLDENLKKYLSNKKLDKKYLQSQKRLKYLKYHRENVFKIDKKIKYL